MNLGLPKLEGSIRKQAKRELRVDKPAWKEYKRQRQGWKQRLFRNVSGPGIPGWIIFGVTVALYQHNGSTRLVNLSLASIEFGFLFCYQLIQRANAGYERSVHVLMPMPDTEFFDRLWRSYLQSWHRGFWLFLVAYGTLLARRETTLHEAIHWPVAALLQVLCGLSLATWLMAYFPRQVQQAMLPFGVLMAALVFMPEQALEPIWLATRLTPGGWVSRALTEPVWAIPACVLAATVPFAYLTLRARWLADLEWKVSPEQPELEDEPQDDEPAGAAVSELANPRIDWNLGGVIERVVARWWTARERVAGEFMFGNALPNWSKAYLWMWGFAAASIVATLIPFCPSWISYVSAGTAALIGAPTLGAPPGFQTANSSGCVIPSYAFFPLSYREISSALAKAHFVRLLFWAPAGFASTTVLALRSGKPLDLALAYGLHIVLLLFAAQPIFITFYFAVVIDLNDVNWQMLFYCVVSMLLALGAFTLNAIGFFGGRFRLMDLTIIPAVLFWALTFLVHDRARMNLLSRPRAT